MQFSQTFQTPFFRFLTGAPWSAEEMVIVKSKLYAMFKGRYLPFASWPGSAQKVLRLAFHDSLRYDVSTNTFFLL